MKMQLTLVLSDDFKPMTDDCVEKCPFGRVHKDTGEKYCNALLYMSENKAPISCIMQQGEVIE